MKKPKNRYEIIHLEEFFITWHIKIYSDTGILYFDDDFRVDLSDFYEWKRKLMTDREAYTQIRQREYNNFKQLMNKEEHIGIELLPSVTDYVLLLYYTIGKMVESMRR